VRKSVAAASRARRAPRANSRRLAAVDDARTRDASDACPASTHPSRISAKKDASAKTRDASAIASFAASFASCTLDARGYDLGPAAATTRATTAAAAPAILSP
jgi:hypothetical protein